MKVFLTLTSCALIGLFLGAQQPNNAVVGKANPWVESAKQSSQEREELLAQSKDERPHSCQLGTAVYNCRGLAVEAGAWFVPPYPLVFPPRPDPPRYTNLRSLYWAPLSQFKSGTQEQIDRWMKDASAGTRFDCEGSDAANYF